MQPLQFLKGKHKNYFIVSGLFFIFYALEAFVNHYHFRTYALDLGAYTNALYDYAHFRFNDKGTFKEVSENLLSDHVDLYLPIFGLFSHVFGQYTLQFFQILFVLIGGWGIYRLTEVQGGKKSTQLAALIAFYLFFGIYSALSFDYHSNVISAMLLPLLILQAAKKNISGFYLILIAMLVGKESTSVWLVFVCLGLLIEYRKDLKMRMHFVLGMVLSLGYFLLAVKVIIPSLSNSGQYDHFKFAVLGTDYASALKFILTHPIEFLKIMYSNHSGDAQYDGVKEEFYRFMLFSGGFLVLLRPGYLVMLLPLLVMKMCYNEPSAWSIDAHYSIEFAPVLIAGAFAFICSRKRLAGFWKIMTLLVPVGCLYSTISVMDGTRYWHDYNRMRIYDKDHYSRGYDISAVKKAMKMIPETAAVSAQSPFVPHLAYRDKCYQMPLVKDAEYVLVSEKEDVTYPVSREEMMKLIQDSIATNRWEYMLNDSNVTLIKKR